MENVYKSKVYVYPFVGFRDSSRTQPTNKYEPSGWQGLAWRNMFDNKIHAAQRVNWPVSNKTVIYVVTVPQAKRQWSLIEKQFNYCSSDFENKIRRTSTNHMLSAKSHFYCFWHDVSVQVRSIELFFDITVARTADFSFSVNHDIYKSKAN